MRTTDQYAEIPNKISLHLSDHSSSLNALLFAPNNLFSAHPLVSARLFNNLFNALLFNNLFNALLFNNLFNARPLSSNARLFNNLFNALLFNNLFNARPLSSNARLFNNLFNARSFNHPRHRVPVCLQKPCPFPHFITQ
jgi:hypothetical protein